MSDDNRISRRTSLKGIAATGTFIAGAGLSVTPVSAGKKDKPDGKNGKKTKDETEKKDPDDAPELPGVQRLNFRACDSLAILFNQAFVESAAEDDGIVKNVRIRMYNADREIIENYDRTITVDDLRSTTLHGEDDVDDVFAWTFNSYQFYDRPFRAGDRVVAVTLDGTTFQNPNDCAEPFQTVPDTDGQVDLEEIGFNSVCIDSERGVARFLVLNNNLEQVTLEYAVEETGESGTVSVEPASITYFEVATDDGEATVGLFADSEQFGAAESGETECIPRDQVSFNFECVDTSEEAAQFLIHNGTGSDLTFVYYVPETGETGRITVEDSLASSETFWVNAPDGEVTVGLFYEGENIAVAESDPDETCEDESDSAAIVFQVPE